MYFPMYLSFYCIFLLSLLLLHDLIRQRLTYKKVKTAQKHYFDQLSGAQSTRKLVEIHNTRLKNENENKQVIKSELNLKQFIKSVPLHTK